MPLLHASYSATDTRKHQFCMARIWQVCAQNSWQLPCKEYIVIHNPGKLHRLVSVAHDTQTTTKRVSVVDAADGSRWAEPPDVGTGWDVVAH